MSKEKKEKKPKSLTAKIIEWVITGVFGVLFLFAFAGFIDGMVHKKQYFGETLRFGWATFVVQTDSMADHLPVDSAIITYRESPKKIFNMIQNGKDNIDASFFDYCDTPAPDPSPELDYRTPHKKMVMTHRIIGAFEKTDVKEGDGRYVFYAAGTNPSSDQVGNQYQVFTEKEYLGVVKICSNFLGGFFKFVSSIWGLLILLLVPAFYLVIVSVLDIFKAYKEDDEKEVVATQNADGTAVASEGSGSSRLDSLSDAQREKLKQELLQEMIEKKKNGGNK